MFVVGPFVVIPGISRTFARAIRALVYAGLIRFVEGRRALRLERVR